MSGQPTDNPYAAPQTELHAPDLPYAMETDSLAEQGDAKPSLVNWTIIYILNLPLATLLGVALCNGKPAAFGMIPAIAGYYIGTLYLYRQSGRFAGSWIGGAICVALSQFYPILHFGLGGFAVRFTDGSSLGPLNFFQAVASSFIVGGGLIAVSLLLAAIFYTLFARRDAR